MTQHDNITWCRIYHDPSWSTMICCDINSPLQPWWVPALATQVAFPVESLEMLAPQGMKIKAHVPCPRLNIGKEKSNKMELWNSFRPFGWCTNFFAHYSQKDISLVGNGPNDREGRGWAPHKGWITTAHLWKDLKQLHWARKEWLVGYSYDGKLQSNEGNKTMKRQTLQKEMMIQTQRDQCNYDHPLQPPLSIAPQIHWVCLCWNTYGTFWGSSSFRTVKDSHLRSLCFPTKSRVSAGKMLRVQAIVTSWGSQDKWPWEHHWKMSRNLFIQLIHLQQDTKYVHQQKPSNWIWIVNHTMQRHLGSGQIQGGMPPAGRHKDLSGQTGRPKIKMKDFQELTDGPQKIEVPRKEIIFQTLAFNGKAVGLGEGRNNDKIQKLEPKTSCYNSLDSMDLYHDSRKRFWNWHGQQVWIATGLGM